MIKLLYIHGFGSQYDPNSDKVKAIREHGFEVDGFTIDYTLHKKSLIAMLKFFIRENDIDGVIGTSMGGHMALEIANELSIPVVAINPAIQPHKTLKVGKHIYYTTGKDYYLNQSVIDSYTDATHEAKALIVLNMDDDVICPKDTIYKYSQYYKIEKLSSGGHRCDNILKAMPSIVNFFNHE